MQAEESFEAMRQLRYHDHVEASVHNRKDRLEREDINRWKAAIALKGTTLG